MAQGGILIVTLTLIGTGWAFIKFILSDRDKKLFMIVVPLQIFVNIAFIIFKETEEGEKEYTSWSHVMILLDLLCYALILWPVYWSIKHLQQVCHFLLKYIFLVQVVFKKPSLEVFLILE